MTQEEKDILIFSENDMTNIIDSVSENITTFIEDLNNDVIASEEAIVSYAKLVARNEPEYFERSTKELILEWALKYVDTAVHYGKKIVIMTQEDKELLFKDLSARLPYGVEVEYNSIKCEVLSIDKYNEELTIRVCPGYTPIVKLEKIKPYLFPLSSMTEEQKEELKNEISKQTDILIERMKNDDCGIDCGKYHFHSNLELEWLLKNHFDYRGLIPMDLAIDATGLNIY